MVGRNVLSFMCIFLVLSSLFYQSWYFGVWSAIKTIIGSLVAFLFVVGTRLIGNSLNPRNCKHWLISHLLGYPYISGAKGRIRQAFSLFVLYFSISGALNLPLVDESSKFLLTLFLLTIGLTGITCQWMVRNCQETF